MATISKERLREMEEEMDRFEAEITGSAPLPSFILGANTYEKVQAQLASIRQEATRAQQQQRSLGSRDEDEDEDVDSRFRARQKRKFHDDDDDNDDDDDDGENEYHDIDERPGRPQGPILPPPPPPPPSLMPARPPVLRPPGTDIGTFIPPPPPPPPPPEPDGFSDAGEQSTLSFKPYGPGEGLHIPRPTFMPPQLRHRAPPPGMRPPFMRPPMRMGVPYGGMPGFPRPPHMMPLGPHMNQSGMQGLPGPHMGMTGPPGPPMGMPVSNQATVEASGVQFMAPPIEASQVKPAIVEQPKIVYSAAPVITVERKEDGKKKKKKKKKKGKLDSAGGDNQEGQASKDPPGSGMANTSSSGMTATAEEDKSVMDMEIVPESALVGGIMTISTATGDMTAGLINAANGGQASGKKEKKKKEKKFLRLAANTMWEDPTLAEWAQDDFRMFCGDLGNEVTDDTLVRAFNKYPSFLKAKVIRDRRTNKTKGYGFVSFKDPMDFTRAMREMNGKYVGNRPIKLRKSSWRDRSMEVVRKKEKEKKKLGLR